METTYRKVEIFHDDEWATINFMELKKGDVFRMFDDLTEPNPIEIGEPLVALEAPYPIHDSWAIECIKESDTEFS